MLLGLEVYFKKDKNNFQQFLLLYKYIVQKKWTCVPAPEKQTASLWHIQYSRVNKADAR